MRRVYRFPLGFSLALGVVPAAAAAAPTPTPPARNALTVTVTTPATYHHGQRFAVTVTATLKKRRPHAYLLSFIQYTLKACQSDPNKELARTLDTKGAYYHHEFSASPFTATVNFTAGAPGSRRVCSYLFAKQVQPGTRTTPIATGTASYLVVN